MTAVDAPTRPAPPSRWQRTVGPLRERDFALLWFGELVSSFGGPFQGIAIAFFLIHQGLGPFVFALVIAVFSVSRTVGGFVAGPLLDRYPRVTFLLVANVVAFGASGSVFLLTLTGQGIWFLVPLLAVQAMTGGAYLTAMSSIAPSVLPPEKLPSGNALIQMLSQLPAVAAAPAAGIVASVAGESTAIGINVVSYAFAVAGGFAVYRRRRAGGVPQASGRPSFRQTLRDGLSGLRFAAGEPWLRLLLIIEMVGSAAAAGAMVIALPFYADKLGGSQAYGFLVAGFGAGSIVGMLWFGGLARRIRRRALLICALLLSQGVLLAMLGLLPAGPGVVDLALVGAANGISNVAFAGLVQTVIDDRFLGRVFALEAVATSVLAPLGHLSAGVLIATWGSTVALGIAGLAMAATAATGLVARSVRSIDVQ